MRVGSSKVAVAAPIFSSDSNCNEGISGNYCGSGSDDGGGWDKCGGLNAYQRILCPTKQFLVVHVAEDVRCSLRWRRLNDWYNVKGLFADRAGAPRNVIYVGSHRSGCRTCHRYSRETSKHRYFLLFFSSNISQFLAFTTVTAALIKILCSPRSNLSYETHTNLIRLYRIHSSRELLRFWKRKNYTLEKCSTL